MNGQPVELSETVRADFQKPNLYTLTIEKAPESLNAATVTVAASNVAGETTSDCKLTVSGRAPQFVAKPIKCTILEGIYQ